MVAVQVVSEGPLRITKATVDAAWCRRRPGSRLVVRDQECRGLALVVGATSMAWVFTYKPRGTDPASGRRFATRTLTLGNPGTHSPGEARDAANRVKGQAAAGVDPAAERRDAIHAAAARRVLKVDRLVDDYSAALPKRPKLRGAGIPSQLYVTYELAQLRSAVTAARIGDKAVGDVAPADVRALLAAEAGRPSVARHRFGALSRFFDWCHDEGRLAVNPCTLIAKARRLRATTARAHFLAPAEIARLWRAAGETEAIAPVHRDFARFLMAVPCRRGEAARMDWSQLDLDAGVWSQPGKLTKNRDQHRLHLHTLALGILRERHDAAGRPKGGRVPLAPV